MQHAGEPSGFPDFASFLRHLQEPGLPPAAISPRRYCGALNMELQTLAELAQVHRNTVQRAPESAPLQAYLRAALRVLRAAHEKQGKVERTLFWFRNEPLPGFAYRTAERVLSTEGPEPLLLALHTGMPV